MEISPLQLQRIMIYARASRIMELVEHFNASLPEAQVDTPLRAAMYAGQLGHETMSFRFLEEVWGPTSEQIRYEKNARLGNTEPGDGHRFRGRGAIQLTGRANYAKAGEALSLPLLERPELAALPENAFRVSAWYWRAHDINRFADKGDVDGATKAINGGLNGIQERWRYFDRASEVLGVLTLGVA